LNEVNRTKNYFAGLITGYFATFANIIVGLLLTPFTLRFLDREQYAIFTLAADVLMWLGLMDLGITAGLNVQTAHLTGKPNSERLNSLASTAFYSQLVISIIMLLVGIVLVLGFPRFFPIRSDLRSQAMVIVVLMVIGSAISMSIQTYSGILIAYQQLYVDNLIRLFLIVIRTTLTVILLIRGCGMVSLAIANLIAIVITSGLSVFRTYRMLPDLKIQRKYFSFNSLKQTGSLGIWFSIGTVAGILITSVDRIVTAKMISIEFVTSLSLTGRLYALMGGMLQQVTNTARPMLGQMLGQNKKSNALIIYRQLFALSTGSAVVLAAGLWSVNSSFIYWWVGAKNYGGMWLDFALAINMVVHVWILPNRALLSSALIVRPQAIVRIIEGSVNLILSILLAKLIGIFGIIISTAIAAVFTSCWYMPFLVARYFKMSFIPFIWKDIKNILILIVLLLPLSLLIREISIRFHNMSSFIFCFCFTTLFGSLILWFVVFEKSLRYQILLKTTMLFKGIRKYVFSI
jgi:O-antigen/teichoic acid export membrane protein